MRDELIRFGTSVPFIDEGIYWLLRNLAKRNHDSSYFPDDLEISSAQKPMRLWHIRCSAPRNEKSVGWGDFYFAKDLVKGLKVNGQNAKLLFRSDKVEILPGDVHLVVRGIFPAKPVKNSINILWIISHPEQISVREIKKFDLVFAASEQWAKKMSLKSGKKIQSLLQATNPDEFKPVQNSEPSYGSEFVFVGNSKNRSRDIVHEAIRLGYKVEIYGSGWEGKVPKQMIKNKSINRSEVARIYQSSKAVLNDHWSDMKKNGFISNRVFDALSCGVPVVSDYVVGINELHNANIYSYKTTIELETILDMLNKVENLNDPKKIDHFIKFGELNSFESRASELVESVEGFNLAN